MTNFFKLAPTKLPAPSLSKWAQFISPDVKVYFREKLLFANRTAWLADLNSPKGLGGEPINSSIARLQAFELEDKGIRVLEWAYPYKEGSVFHGVLPYRIVTYYFDRTQLVKVVYDEAMAPIDLRAGGTQGG